MHTSHTSLSNSWDYFMEWSQDISPGVHEQEEDFFAKDPSEESLVHEEKQASLVNPPVSSYLTQEEGDCQEEDFTLEEGNVILTNSPPHVTSEFNPPQEFFILSFHDEDLIKQSNTLPMDYSAGSVENVQTSIKRKQTEAKISHRTPIANSTQTKRRKILRKSTAQKQIDELNVIKKEDTIEEKREKKLMANRASAVKSRQRAKQKMQKLEDVRKQFIALGEHVEKMVRKYRLGNPNTALEITSIPQKIQDPTSDYDDQIVKIYQARIPQVVEKVLNENAQLQKQIKTLEKKNLELLELFNSLNKQV
jgi:hypothetical protein